MTNQDLNEAIHHVKVAVEEFNDTIENEKSEEAKLLAIGTKFGMKWVADLLSKGEIDTLPVVASQRYKHTRNQVMRREASRIKLLNYHRLSWGLNLLPMQSLKRSTTVS